MGLPAQGHPAIDMAGEAELGLITLTEADHPLGGRQVQQGIGSGVWHRQRRLRAVGQGVGWRPGEAGFGGPFQLALSGVAHRLRRG